jgi:UDP-N-acetylmuramoyl-L-alanyl-D-glutamate--2,6-diaminopimelate ligase
MIDINLDNINHVTSDSRYVTANSIFVAISGTKDDGHKYIDDAIAKGCKIIICSQKPTAHENVNFIQVAETRIALSEIAKRIYTPHPKNIVAITGTSGKTSVAYYFKQIIESLGNKSASIGTLGVLADGFPIENTLTTPSTEQLHKILQKLAQKNVNYVAIEASSHGLDQHRLDHVELKAAAIINFSRDHLDYHHTMEEYFAAKMRLFTNVLPNDGTAVLNTDMNEYPDIAKICKQRGQKVISFGKNSDDLKLVSVEQGQNHLSLKIKVYGVDHEINCEHIVGNFQAYNILCSIGLVMGCGFDLSKILPVISKLYSAPGRMQKIGNANVFVDYAHKPEALEKTLQTLRTSFTGKVIVVFGCGGDRDQGKRPIMGEIAKKHGDIVIVTDDNPRNEDPKSIRNAIMQTCDTAIEIGDREQAIKYAIEAISSPDDAVLIAGKGHEAYQIVGTETFEFDDCKMAEKYLHLINFN